MSEQVVKRYVSTRLLPDASTWNVSGAAHTYVHISDYDALHAEAEALRAALLGIASVNPAERGIEWAKSYASDGLKGAGSELYARWLDTFKEAEALRAENERLRPIVATTFKIGQRVRKKSGSEWQGRIVGTYSTELTKEGYAVESEAHAGSVQIYPTSALEAVE